MADSESAAAPGSEPATVKRWERRELPERYRGSGMMLGGLFLGGALVLAAIPFFMGADYGAGATIGLLMLFWPPAGALLLIGMWIIAVCMVLREIRLQAFEAAVRGGDLVEVEVPVRPMGRF